MFGHFPVEHPGPVVLYIAEGGREPFQRRAQRVADAYKVNLEDLPLEIVFGMAPLNGQDFLEHAREVIDEVQPVLFGLDPLYASTCPGKQRQRSARACRLRGQRRSPNHPIRHGGPARGPFAAARLTAIAPSTSGAISEVSILFSTSAISGASGWKRAKYCVMNAGELVNTRPQPASSRASSPRRPTAA